MHLNHSKYKLFEHANATLILLVFLLIRLGEGNSVKLVWLSFEKGSTLRRNKVVSSKF